MIDKEKLSDLRACCAVLMQFPGCVPARTEAAILARELFPPMAAAPELLAENERLKKQLHDARAAIEAIETFAAKVAGGSSWWDDVWCAHQAVLDGVCESVRDYDVAAAVQS